MTSSTTTLHELAGEAYSLFERRTRRDADETAYTTLKDGAPQWLHDLVHEAHGDMLPDDWRYDCIHEALGAIHDADADTDPNEIEHEFADGVDVYSGSLLAWLASHLERPGYCDEAQREGLAGDEPDVLDLIGLGQYMERREVFGLVAQALREHVESLDDES